MLREVTIPPGASGLTVAWEALRQWSGPLALAPAPDGTAATDRVRQALGVHGDPQELDGIAFVVATSGSTGAPRGVLFTPDAFFAFADGPRLQWIAALPLISIGGLNVVTRALRHDLPPIALPSIGGAEPFRASLVVDAVRAAHAAPAAISLVPTQLALCLRDGEAQAALRDCAVVLVGGAAIPQRLATACADAGVQFITTYGMTETAGGCVYDGVPLPGVSVDCDPDGRIVINGPMVASGYRLDPAATQRAFTPAGFRTSDLGRWLPDGRLEIVGRIDDVINIKGVTVSTSAVEEAIRSIIDVTDCAVTVHRGNEHTPHLVAWVQSTEATTEHVRAAVARELGDAAVPKAVHIVATLPHLPNGKIDRQALERHGNGG